MTDLYVLLLYVGPLTFGERNLFCAIRQVSVLPHLYELSPTADSFLITHPLCQEEEINMPLTYFFPSQNVFKNINRGSIALVHAHSNVTARTARLNTESLDKEQTLGREMFLN